MNRGAFLTWGSFAVAAAFMVAGALKRHSPEETRPPATEAPEATPPADIPMADRPPSASGIHLTDQGGAPEVSTAPRELPHLYASVDDREFSYPRSPTEDERSRGIDHLRPLKIRYLGRNAAGAYVFTSTSLGGYRFLWCSDPCTVMQTSLPIGGQSILSEADARAPSILHDVYLDAAAGALDFAITPVNADAYQPTRTQPEPSDPAQPHPLVR